MEQQIHPVGQGHSFNQVPTGFEPVVKTLVNEPSFVMVKVSPVSTGQPTTVSNEMEWVDDPKISPLQAKGGRVDVLAMITGFSCAKNTTFGLRITKYAHTLKHLHSTVHSTYTACHVLNLSPQSSEVNVVSISNAFEMKESNK